MESARAWVSATVRGTRFRPLCEPSYHADALFTLIVVAGQVAARRYETLISISRPPTRTRALARASRLITGLSAV